MIDFNKYKSDIENICKRYNVKKLLLFGSALSNNFNSSSDVDLIIEFTNSKNGIKKFMNVINELESLFNKKVDLVMNKALENKRLRKHIYSNTRKLYEA